MSYMKKMVPSYAGTIIISFVVLKNHNDHYGSRNTITPTSPGPVLIASVAVI